MSKYINHEAPFEEWIKFHKNKYTIDPISNCWVWHGATNGNGYSRVSCGRGNKMVPAHREFYERKYGKIPDGLEPHHTCKNYKCVNPDHVEPKTHQENCAADFNKITEAQVAEMVVLYSQRRSATYLGAKYGVDKATVVSILCKQGITIRRYKWD